MPSQAIGLKRWFFHCVWTEGAGPLVAEVVEHVDEAGLVYVVVFVADALHHVEVRIGVKDLGVAAGVFVVRIDEGVDAVGSKRASEALL